LTYCHSTFIYNDDSESLYMSILSNILPVQYLSGFFLATVEVSSGIRPSCYWTDWNRANTENIRIELVFAVLAQWKFLYCIDRFDPCWCGRNIVWNMERDQSFWITSSEHQGTMPKRIFSFSCSMQVIQFADLQFNNLNQVVHTLE
jgi:hypothetical protein